MLMDMKLVEKIIENRPLSIIAIGVFLILIGAAGGWPYIGIHVSDPGWRIALASLGALACGIGGLLIWRTRTGNGTNEHLREDYGIKFTSPSHHKEVGDRFDVEGVYRIKPPVDIVLAIFEYSPNSRQYYPKRLAHFDENLKMWKAPTIGIGGDPGDERIIAAVIMGEEGLSLWDYSDKLTKIIHQIRDKHNEKVRVPGLANLTSDMLECDRVTVRRRN
jgi:hypothetical protein